MRRDRLRRIVEVVVAVAIFAAAAWYVHVAAPSGDAGRLFGYVPNPEGVEAFLSELDRPLFADAGRECIAKRAYKDTFLYRSALRAHVAVYGEPWKVPKQEIGDCVSMGWATGIWISQAVAWELGEVPEPPPLVCTEGIYGGSRVEARNKDGSGRSPVGGYGDGSYGAAAARWVRDWGVTYRIIYPFSEGGHDLRVYNAGNRAKAWGAFGNGGEGDGGKFDAVAKKHPAKHVALVKTADEAAAAIESGYCVPVCCGLGFSSQRDADGFSRQQGSWAHCQCLIAVRYKRNGSPRDGLLVCNSWGAWNGPRENRWPDDMPDGCYWVDFPTADRMLSGGDSFAVGGIDGFKWRDLHHGEWLAPLPESIVR